jgi:hypothetical protein
MGTQPMPSPDQQGQGAAPPQGGGSPPDQGNGGQQPPPDQGGQQPQSSFAAPANPIQMLLAKWSKVAEQMGSADPRLAAGAQKVREGIREMQTALITPQQPTPMGQQPQ